MPTHIALLRAVNVGGTGKLPMTDLREMCENLGFSGVRTYIQSGNVVFDSRAGAVGVKANLEAALAKKLGKPCAVMVRSLAEMQKVESENPFPKGDPSQVLVVFLDEPADPALLKAVKIPGNEKLKAVGREVFIHFPEGMGKSKLKVPGANIGTGRNMNTVRALIELASTRKA
jgi:uncharacterized protein (DUF1697 family)